MSNRFLLLSSLVVLGGCAYAIDDSVQDLTIHTPGAEDALCHAYIDDLRHKFRPPQTQRVSKSKNDMIIDCYAPGNRRKKVVIKPDIEQSTYGNIFTGVVPGAAWDYASEAMFKYPDIVEVNFENTPVRPEDLPAQNNPDIRQPEDYMLEEFRPGQPRLNSDRYQATTEIQRRQTPASISTTTGNYVSDTLDTSTIPPLDKGDLMDVIQDLGTENVNPSAEPPPPSSTDEVYGPPVPLFPGQ